MTTRAHRFEPLILSAILLPFVVAACATGVDPEGPEVVSSAGGDGGPSSGGSPPVGSGGFVSGSGGAGGTGGVSGTGGVAGGAGSGGGSTGGTGGMDTGPPPPVPIGDLVVQYKTTDEVADNEMKPHLAVVNRGTTPVPLEFITMRYWYTADGTPSGTDYQELHVDYADIGRLTNNMTSVVLSFAQVTPPEPGADHYIEIGFSGPDTLTTSTNQIELRINWKGYSTNYDESDDYSWDGTKTAFTDSHTVTLYLAGKLVWGREPDGTEPMPEGDAGLPPLMDSGAMPDGATTTDAGN